MKVGRILLEAGIAKADEVIYCLSIGVDEFYSLIYGEKRGAGEFRGSENEGDG